MSGNRPKRRAGIVGDINRLTKNLGAPRRLAIKVYATALRANVFLPPPKVLLNGPGKSGTHLAADCLSLMPGMMFSGRHFALHDFVAPPDDPSEAQSFYDRPDISLDARGMERFVGGCPNGMFVTSHARYHTVMRDVMLRHDMKHLLLVRNPRDLVVSFVFFVLREKLHPHHDYFAKSLKTDGERIEATIRGFEYVNENGQRKKQASIGEIFDGFAAWTKDPKLDTLLIRFENLAGVAGGTGEEEQLEEIERIGDFVGRPTSREGAGSIAGRAYGRKNLTFRKGLSGEWREHFTRRHVEAFEEVAGEVAGSLGYPNR